jgi:hypothetical protein
MTQTPRLSLAFLAPAQSQKHVTVNEALRKIDQIVQLCVLSRSLTAQPGAPADGDAYVIPDGATGAQWSQMNDGQIAAFADGAWTALTPRDGWRAYVADTGRFDYFDGASWKEEPAPTGITLGSASKIGVNVVTPNEQLVVRGPDARIRIDNDVPNAGVVGVEFTHLNNGGNQKKAAILSEPIVSWGRSNLHFCLNVAASLDNVSIADARITIAGSTGFVGIGATAPACALDVNGPARVRSYPRASLPSAAAGAGQIIYVSDEAGGATIAFSDGENWRRVADRAVVS